MMIVVCAVTVYGAMLCRARLCCSKS